MINIGNLIQKGEGTSVEFKEEMNDGAYKTLTAFANTEGGFLFCGVRDDKTTIKTDTSNKNIDRVTNIIVNNIKINPNINIVEVDGIKLLCIKVEKSHFPVSYNNIHYIRVGSTTRKLDGENLVNFIAKFQNMPTWDSLTGDYDFDEIDEETLNHFIDIGLKNGRLDHITPNDELSDKLEHLSLIKNGKLTNAAIILFGKNPQKYFLNAVVKIAKLEDEITIVNNEYVEGNLFQQIAESEKEIKNNIQVRHLIPKNSFQRKDVWEYPIYAMRESLLNAIIHRDYFKNNVATQVKIFKSCIYIYNIGGLPEGITIEQLKKTHSSVARNPLILRIIYRAGFIEEMGTGIKRMRDSLKEAGHPDVQFKNEPSSFTICIWGRFSKKNLKEKEVNERQMKALRYIYENGMITMNEYMELVPETKERTLRRDLNHLVEKNLLKSAGKTKGRKYLFNDELKNYSNNSDIFPDNSDIIRT